VWSNNAAVPVATPAWLEWVNATNPMSGPTGSLLSVNV
jgi:hypothetical protein